MKGKYDTVLVEAQRNVKAKRVMNMLKQRWTVVYKYKAYNKILQEGAITGSQVCVKELASPLFGSSA